MMIIGVATDIIFSKSYTNKAPLMLRSVMLSYPRHMLVKRGQTTLLSYSKT